MIREGRQLLRNLSRRESAFCNERQECKMPQTESHICRGNWRFGSADWQNLLREQSEDDVCKGLKLESRVSYGIVA